MISFELINKSAGRAFKAGVKRYALQARAAMLAAALEATKIIERRGRADIRKAGRFGSRWTQGLNSNVVREGEDIVIRTTLDPGMPGGVPAARLFMRGGIIKGRPLLWIPLSFAHDARGVRARDYPGRLFRVDRRGKAPLLLSVSDGQPKYFGKAQVRIPRKFNLLSIIRDVAREMRTLYEKHFRKET